MGASSPFRVTKITILLACIACVIGACNLPAPVTPTSTATSTAVVTAMSTVEPILTSTPTPSPIPPLVSITEGEQALFYGDWDAALEIYNASLNSSPEPDIRSAALLGLGRTYYEIKDFEAALQNLQRLLNEYPNSEHIPPAHILMAESYKGLERYVEAANHYAAYLTIRPGLIDSYIHEYRADALVAAGDFSAAINAYQAALSAPRATDSLSIEIKIANTYVYQDDYNTALVAYQDLYNRSGNDFTKAFLDFQMGQAFTAIGQIDQANAAYLDAVQNYPLSYDSYQALIILVESGYPVSEFDRGLVDYFAGQYSLSIAAFDRYLSTTNENASTVHYYRGMAFRALGEIETAIATWDLVIQGDPEAPWYDEAWEQKAYTQWAYLEQYDIAQQTLLDFVDLNPWHERAAEFLFDAALIAERDRDLALAASIWQRIPPEYPSSGYVSRSIFLSGISYYRLADYQNALAEFERYSGAAATLGDRAAAQLWIGKTYQVLGDDTAAQAAFGRAVNEDPTGYYSERARDILLDRQPFEPPLVYDLGYDPEYDRIEAEHWMREVFAIPEGVDFGGLGDLLTDARVIRGTELWNLGLYDQARLEFELLWQDVRHDPLSNYRLANYLVELGIYRTAIFAAREVLNLNDMDDAATMNAPIFFNHIRFGSYFRELVVPISQAYDFHPLFLFSVIRQESLFESWVQSSAGALGLMQIIPSTGANIAEQASWPPNYSVDDLNRPKVSITFGADYLADQRDYFNGEYYTALAAYNGGPGNAAIWRELAGDDPDLFLEVIRFEETRRYIRGIYEIFSIYRRLYDRTP